MGKPEQKINVYSEIGQLKRVLVHRPGKELSYLTPQRLDELLFSAILEVETAQKEHDAFTNILRKEGVEVVELADLVAETYDEATPDAKNQFVETWLDESSPKLSKEMRQKVKDYILLFKTREMIDLMMAGITSWDLGVDSSNGELIVDPMPNLYFARDPYASIGNGASINRMKYLTRQRETLFANFIFSHNKNYKNTPLYFSREDKTPIEGGDIFVYNEKTLVMGVSERTELKTIETIGQNIKNNKDCKFEKIIAINVPPMPNLMHLDTWLTMLDTNKFLYSPNMLGVLKIWEINLLDEKIKAIEQKKDIKTVLREIIGEEPILIPIGGEGASQIDIDVETHFDGTNYLVISPGVVVGYDRNKKTEAALKKAGIKVLSFTGNQLSLGMGSARCMSMPLYREPVLKK